MYQGPKISLENLIVGGEYKSYGTNWMWFGAWFWSFLHAHVQFFNHILANDAAKPSFKL